MTPEKTYTPFLDVLLKVAGNPALPEGYDAWGFKITRADLRTWGAPGERYRWPDPGNSVDDPATVVNGDPCPRNGGGGFCIALSLQGAASAGYGHGTILLLAYRKGDIAGRGSGKIRVSHCRVVDILDGEGAYAQAAGADLRGADLGYAYLRGADLRGANLGFAYLRGANLGFAYLRGANLGFADLRSAYLRYADLRGADLGFADLRGANLRYAPLEGANLRGTRT